MKSERVKKGLQGQLKSDYYIVYINPDLHQQDWNTLRLYLTIAEAEYLLFYDYEIEYMQLRPVLKNEFKSFYYNPN